MISRRSFLKAVGASAAALPFYGMLERSAMGAPLPLKFVGVAFPHCKPARYYYRRPGETADTYDLSYAECALKPFAPYKDKTIIFEGFGYHVGDGNDADEQYVDMHGAMGLMLTNSAAKVKLDAMNYAMQNASLDQYLAQKYGGDTPYRSVVLATESMGGQASTSGSFDSISYAGPGSPMSRITSPELIWNSYFKNFALSSTDPSAAAAAARVRRIRQSQLDFLTADVARLQSRLAPTERQKLDQHLTAMRDIERRLNAEPPVYAAACEVPAFHQQQGNYTVGTQWNGALPYFDMIANLQIELLAELLICGLTRFATLTLHTVLEAPTNRYCDLDLPGDFHNDIAHESESGEAVDKLQASMCRYYYGKVTSLMDRLQAAGALDSTLILVGNEGGHGSGHSHDDVPFVLAGGANGAIRMGRRILAPGRTPPTSAGQEPGGSKSNASHAPILVGVANAFGDPIASYGTAGNAALTAGISGFLT